MSRVADIADGHDDDGWRHDDPDIACILIGGGLRGASACVAPAVAEHARFAA